MTPAKPDRVVLEHVSKSFSHNGDSVEVLQDVNFAIGDGEFVCLVGPSGCGKSTLINILAGLDRAYTGKVLVDGKPVRGPGTDRIAVFQESALFPWLTVQENVEFGLRMRGVAPLERRDRAAEYLKMVHLNRFTRAYPHQLSGGMKQRAAIARALVMDPKILLMDEPFGALDAQTRRLLHQELMEIWKQTHKIVFFVTHNVREATVLGDKVLTMTARPGRIKTGYAIRLPRPRRESDPHLIVIQQRILLGLQEEIAKVVKEEDLDYLMEAEEAIPPTLEGGGAV